MPDPDISPALAQARREFDELVRDIRVELHRYCARMTGSVVEGEDVVQETLAKAFFLLPTVGPSPNLRAWLFRIGHNKSIDYLRRYDRRHVEPLDEHPEVGVDSDPLQAAEVAELTLSWFLKLTALQRSAVILMDIMGYSMAEISELLDLSLPAIKGALHRGRAALRKLAGAAHEGGRAPLDATEERLLARYVEHFNARDFDALRTMLAEDARLELVGRLAARGAPAVGSYFSNYERLEGWRVEMGTVDDRPALLGFDGDNARSPGARPTFFILVEWVGDRIQRIRDYRYARHVTELADFGGTG